MRSYLDIVQNILDNGVSKQPTRMENGKAVDVENGTIGTFCEIFRHNMSEGFPLLTCRKLPLKNTLIELEGFIQGITDKKWYQDRGCPYWNWWANPEKVNDIIHDCAEYEGNSDILEDREYRKIVQKEEKDLGKIYGSQWREFHDPTATVDENDLHGTKYGQGSYLGDNKYDQLEEIVNKLRDNPYDRRMVCSAWNPNALHTMALPPCHVLWNVVVYGNKLNLTWFQRSNDILVGNPANIASYATLLLLLCKSSNLEPGELVGIFSDAHIYNNQINNAKLLLQRKPKDLPLLEINSQDNLFDIFKWTHEDVKLSNYNPHPSMKFELTV